VTTRTDLGRLRAIAPAIAAGEAFCARVTAATGVLELADLMAEAIEMGRAARGLEIVGSDGRSTLCMEQLQAEYCMDAAREAYLRARGRNSA